MKKQNNVSIGNCGEYFVAAELERRGFSVAVPMSNTEMFDILALDRETNEKWAIQVKTTEKDEWTLNVKNENMIDDRTVYIFVKLKEMPEYTIVPSKVVAKYVKESHQIWLKTPGKNGRQHKDNPMRKYRDLENKYINNWNALKTKN